LNNKDLPWDWNTFYEHHEYKDVDLVKEFPEYKWNWEKITKYISIDFIFENPQYPWDVYSLSKNPSVKYFHIINHPKVKWNWAHLSAVMNINEIENNPDNRWETGYGNDEYALTYGLSINNTITTEYVLNNINLKWNWELLVYNPNLDFNKMLDTGIDWNYILTGIVSRNILESGNKTVIKFIVKYISKFKNIFNYTWGEFHSSGVAAMTDIINYPELIHDYLSLSKNPNLEMWYIIQNINEKWNWDILTANRGLKINEIKKILTLAKERINYLAIVINPNLTYEYIWLNRKKLLDSYASNYLSGNSYTLENNRRKVIQKLENKYLIRKTKRVAKILKKNDIIPDLTKIIIEY
jgi:hypothetical protein